MVARRRAALLALLAVFPSAAPSLPLSGTAASAVRRASARAHVDTLFDTVFVVSNRRRERDGFLRQATDSLWHGIYVARTVRSDRDVRARSALKVTRTDSATLTPEEWRTQLRAAAQRDTSARGAALLFVHGYATAPGTALAQGEQVKQRGAHHGPLVLFVWPTHNIGVAPPTPTRVYSDDGRAAAASVGAFASVLRTVDSLADGAVLIAHSMGSRIALGALVDDTLTRAAFAARPLRAVGLFSPDVGAERFRRDYAPTLPSLSRRVAMYGAATDYLLGASALLNRERRASGLTRSGEVLPGIELVDDTRGERADPVPLNLIGPRHAVRWAAAALADFFSIVVSGADPMCRVRNEMADSTDMGRWRLRANALPSAWIGPNCAPMP